MAPISHVAISSVISAVFAFYTRSFMGTAACFLSGIFIDIDHIFDYWLARKQLFVTYSKLFGFCGLERGGKLYLLFHSFEFLVLFWLIFFTFQLNVFWLGLGIGVTAHMIADQFANPLRPYALFFVYRLRHRFEKECVFPADYYKKMK